MLSELHIPALAAVMVSAFLLPARDSQSGTHTRETIQWRISLAERDNAERAKNLALLFGEAGCGPGLVRQRVKKLKSSNFVCTLPGETDSTIVVGAHYEATGMSQAAACDWSGTALLPSLLEDLRSSKRRHTFVFVAFAGQVFGMAGSEAYVEALTPQQKTKMAAMVHIDSLGLSDTKVALRHSDAALVRVLAQAARTLNTPLGPVEFGRTDMLNSESFRSRKIPSIDIHSLTSRTQSIPGSAWDGLSLIDPEAYYRTYQLLSAYLAALDSELP